MIKSAMGRAIPATISKDLHKKTGKAKAKKENIIPTNEEIIMGFRKILVSILMSDIMVFLFLLE